MEIIIALIIVSLVYFWFKTYRQQQELNFLRWWCESREARKQYICEVCELYGRETNCHQSPCNYYGEDE